MKRSHDCPPYCHPCAYLGGAIMPVCMGTATNAQDEMSLLHCTCVPGFPSLAQMECAERLAVAMAHLRDTRRRRLVQRVTVDRLQRHAKALQFTVGVHARARQLALEIEQEIGNLRSQLRGCYDEAHPFPHD